MGQRIAIGLAAIVAAAHHPAVDDHHCAYRYLAQGSGLAGKIQGLGDEATILRRWGRRAA